MRLMLLRIMKKFIILLFVIPCFFACADNIVIDNPISEDLSEFENVEETIYNDDDLYSDVSTIRQGLVCNHASKILYYKRGLLKATIYLTEPITIAKSDKAERWGIYQFPGIMRINDSILLARWSMQVDEQDSYGKIEEAKLSSRISVDNGKTWTEPSSTFEIPDRGEAFLFFNNGGWLSTQTPEIIPITSYPQFPEPIGKYEDKVFYKMSDVPDELQGAYFTIFKDGERRTFQGKIDDPEAIRYASQGYVNVLWPGNFLELENESVLACIYSNRIEGNSVAPQGVLIYRTTDKGDNWSFLSFIPFPKSLWRENIEGFSEPVLSKLYDGSLICVIRSTDGFEDTPMYKCFSKDGGQTWTDPVAFASNGCDPRLLTLKNGVIVLTSGRPGVQLRFSIDGKANEWTNPIEMMSFLDRNGPTGHLASCGYTSIIRAGDNSFFMVYSEFGDEEKTKYSKKEIKFRKVTILLP